MAQREAIQLSEAVVCSIWADQLLRARSGQSETADRWANLLSGTQPIETGCGYDPKLPALRKHIEPDRVTQKMQVNLDRSSFSLLCSVIVPACGATSVNAELRASFIEGAPMDRFQIRNESECILQDTEVLVDLVDRRLRRKQQHTPIGRGATFEEIGFQIQN